MADLATLGVQFTTSGSAEQDRALDSKVTKSAAAQKATDALRKADDQAASAVRQMAEAIRAQEAILMAHARAMGVASGAAVKYSSTADALAKTWGAVGRQERELVAAQNAMAATWGKLTPATTAGGKAVGLTAFQMKQLAVQMPDVIQQLLAGQRPMTLLIQQGGQMAQILQMGPGGLGGALRGLVGLIGPAVIGFGSLAAAVGVATAAFLAGEKESNAFANAIAITGNFADLNAAKFTAMARAIGKETEAGAGKARSVMLALVQTGQFTGDTIEHLAPSIIKLAQFTGQTTDDVAADFAKMGGKVGDFAAQFNSHYHMLTEAQIEHIRLLEEQGRTTQAQLELAIGIHRRLGQIGPENLGLLESAWRGVANAIGFAWEQLKGFGRAQGVEGQIGELTKRLQNNNYGFGMSGSARADMQKQLETLQAQLQTQTKLGEAQAEQSRTQQAGADAAARMRTQWSGLTKDVAKANTEIAKFRADIEAIRKANPNSPLIPSAARQAQMEAAIRKQNTVSAGHTPRDTNDERSAQLSQQIAQAKAEELQAQLSLTKDVQQQATIQKQIIDAQLAAKQAQVDRQIADIKDDKGLSAAKRAQLIGQLQEVKSINDSVAEMQTRAADEKEAAAIAKETLQARTADLQNQADLLTAQGALARSTAEQSAIATRLLKIKQEGEIAAQEQITQANGYSAAEVDIAEKRLAILKNIHPLQQRAQDEAAAAAAIREEASIAQDRLERQVAILSSQRDASKIATERADLDKRILEIQQEIARNKAAEAIQVALALGDQTAITKALADNAALLESQANEQRGRAKNLSERMDDMLQGYREVNDALGSMADAFASHDWVGAVQGLAKAIDSLKVAFGPGGTLQGKVAAIGAALNQIGQMIGGSAGNLVSSTGSGAVAGATIGTMIAPGIGTAIGAIVGGIGGFISGLFGNSKAKKEAEARKAQQEAERQAAIALQHRQLEIAIYELEGNELAALTARRNDELDAMDPSNRALAQRVYQLQDEAAAAAKAKEIADQRSALELRILELDGEKSEFLRRTREAELAALDPSLRELQSLIYAREDEAAAMEEQRAAQERASQLARDRASLEIELMNAQGDAAGALAMQREQELAAMDESLRALARQVYAAQDLAKAQQDQADAALRAADAIAAANDNLLQSTQDVAAARANLADLEREAMNRVQQAHVDALQAIADAAQDTLQRLTDAAAAARQRADDARSALQAAYERERDVLLSVAQRVTDARSVLTQAYERERDALLAVSQRVDDARAVLVESYRREAGELQATIDRLKDLADTLRQFRSALNFNPLAGQDVFKEYRASRAAFMSAGPQDIPEAGQRFLEASRGRASTQIDYLRDLAMVRRRTDAAIGSTEKELTVAEKQLAALTDQVGKLVDLGDKVVSVKDAIKALQGAQAAEVAAQKQLAALDRSVVGLIDVGDKVVSVKDAIRELKAAMAADAVAQKQLEALDKSVASLLGLDAKVLTVKEAIVALKAANGADAQAQRAVQAAQVNYASAQLQATQAQTALQASLAAQQAQAQAQALDVARQQLAAALKALQISQDIITGPTTTSTRETATAALLAGSAAAAQAYLKANPDLRDRYAHPTASGFNRLQGESEIDFALRHFKTIGRFEAGRNLFAAGGSFMGGLRIVGEQGPELEATGPSRIWSADQTRRMLRPANDDGAMRDLVSEVRSMRLELAEMRADTAKTAKATDSMSKTGIYARGRAPGTAVETEAAA